MKQKTQEYLAPTTKLIEVHVQYGILSASLLGEGGNSSNEIYDLDEI
jgi:hypothetical protein